MAINQLKAGAVMNYIVILLNTIVGLLYTPYMMHKMGQNEYGLYSLVASIISYLTILDLGFGNAIIRYTAKYRAENNYKKQYEMFGMFFILYLGLGVLAVIGGTVLCFNIDTFFDGTMTVYEIDRARTMMILLVFNLAFTFPMSVFGSVINAYEKFVFQKSINIIRIILNTAVMIALLHLGYKALAMVVVQTIFNITTLIINYIYCKKKLHVELHFVRFDWSFLKEVSIYSFWIFLNIIMDRIYWSTGQFVLGAFVGTAAIAVFATAIHLQHMYMQFSTAISTVFLPKVTKMVTKNSTENEISDLFIRTGRIQYIVMAFILTGFILFGRQFIHLWVGIEYDAAYIICIMFFASLTIPLIQNLGVTILQARNQMKFRSLLYVVISLIALVFQIYLAQIYGEVGCAIAVSVALLLGQGLIMNIYYQKKQNLNVLKFWAEIIKMSFIPIILGLSAYILIKDNEIASWGELATYVLLFSIIYIPLFYRFSMNAYERNMMKAPIKSIYSKLYHRF